MAYRTRRSYRTRSRSSYRPRSYRGSYRTRSGRRGRRVRSSGRTARIVIQVAGGPAGVASTGAALGMKAAKPVRARY